MSQKKYFELLNGKVISDKEVKLYIFSFKSFKNRINNLGSDKDEINPLVTYFDAFYRLCQDKKTQILLNEINWGENNELRKIFQNKVNSIESDRHRDVQYAMLRENIHKLSKEEKIQYRPASQTIKQSKDKKYGCFSFNSSPLSEEIDDIDLKFIKNTNLDLNCAFQRNTTNIKIIAELARLTWEHIYNHFENVEKNINSPWISIRTLKAYIQNCCSHENLLSLFGKRLEDGQASLDAPIGNDGVALIDFMTSERGTTEEMEKCIRVTSHMKELAENFLTVYEKYALTICISYVCKKISATVIDNILNEHRKADNRVKKMYKNTETFLLNNGLHPDCADYEKEQVLAFFDSLHDPCHESILPGGCPRSTAVCATESEMYPCTNIS